MNDLIQPKESSIIPTNLTPEVQPKPKKTFWIILSLIFVFLFLLVSAILIYTLFKSKQIYQPEKTVKPTNTTPSALLTEEPVITQASPLNLNDFPNKEMIGENTNYSVYWSDVPSIEDAVKNGKIIVYDKKSGYIIKISGQFSIFGGTKILDSGDGKHILLASGTDVYGNIILISLEKKTSIGENFLANKSYLYFYKDYLIYGGENQSYTDRPYGSGYASNVEFFNLKTEKKSILVEADTTHDYLPININGDKLSYQETYVSGKSDWQNYDNIKTNTKTYNLLSL